MREFDIKKIIIYGVAAFIVLGVIGGLIYYFLLRPTPETQPTGFGTLPTTTNRGTNGGIRGGTAQQGAAGVQTITATPTGTLNIGTTTPEALKQIIQKPILAPTLSPKGNAILYYVRAGGKAESIDFNGENVTQISNLTILNTLGVAWQSVKEKSIISYLDSEILKTFVMAIATTTQAVFLPETTVNASWSPDGKSIAYLTRQENSASLFISGSSGKSGKFIFSPTIPDFSIQWIAKNKILFTTKPSGFAPSMAYLFDTGTKGFPKIIDRVFGLTDAASPDGKLLLYTKADSAGGTLNTNISNADGSSSRALPLITMPEKCVFGAKNENLFCAVPRNIANFTTLPDDWYMGKGFFSDAIIMMNIKTLATATLTPAIPVDVINPFLSPQEDFLFFQNKKDYSLWRLKLK